ncbi:MAG: flavodoxin domain-containing protein [Nocardioides sp.]
MTTLVAHASKYGATRGIAERIGEVIAATGREVQVLPVDEVHDAASYDAFVIGGAAYRGAWMPAATTFVRGHVDLLASRPVWLFSSGPLGDPLPDVDVEPREFRQLEDAVAPVDVAVFAGALDPARLGLADRLVRRVPAGRRLLPEGDFRDWPAVEQWAREIAERLPGPRRGDRPVTRAEPPPRR